MMKKGKLNLDKKTIAKLSNENLDSIYGGNRKKTVNTFCCSSINIEPEEPSDTEEAAPDDRIIISCKK